MWWTGKKNKKNTPEIEKPQKIKPIKEQIVEEPKEEVKKPPTKKPAKKKSPKSLKTKEKIYVGDKNKIVTLRLSHDLLTKIKKHATENKKMTLSEFTRHLYNNELTKLNVDFKELQNNNSNLEITVEKDI